MDVKELLQGYGERYEKLLLFEPLNKLSAMQRKDAQNELIDMRGLGLLTLVFFFEQKIMRNVKVGRKQLAESKAKRMNYQMNCSCLQIKFSKLKRNLSIFIQK